MSNTREKLDRLADLIKRREKEIDNLRRGLTRREIEQKIACLPFEFPQELYELYQWRNGIEQPSTDLLSPFLFRDHYLSNLDDAIENYLAIQTSFNTEEDRKIADWSKSFPFAYFEGSYLLIILGKHFLEKKYKYPIINIFEGVELWFCSFDSMLDTCIEWNQQTFEKYDTPKDEINIWQKHNPGIFKIDLLHL